MRLDDVADKLSYRFQRVLALDEPSRQIIQYSLTMVLSTIISAALTALMGWLARAFWPTMAVALSAAWLRNFSGGAHCSSAGRCAAAGAIFTPLLGLAALRTAPLLGSWNYAFIAIGWAASLAIIAAKAPDEAPTKPIPARRKPILRRRSLLWASILGAAALLACWPASWLGLSIALGLLWQAFTLLPAGHGFTARVDGLLSRWIRI